MYSVAMVWYEFVWYVRVPGRVPSDAAVGGGVDDGDEVLRARRAAGRGAQVRRAQDLRR